MSYFPRYRYVEKPGSPTVYETARRYGPSEWVGPRTPGDRTLGLKGTRSSGRKTRIQVTRVLNYQTMLRYPVELEFIKTC